MSTSSSSKSKSLVKSSYNKIAPLYTSWTLESGPSLRLTYLNYILPILPLKSHILELGTGAGTPILETLVNHQPPIEKIYANDISSTQISLAKERIGKNDERVEWIEDDMLDIQLEGESLDAVVAFYSIFHLPRGEQKIMLEKVYKWLKEGGGLVMNFGTTDEEAIRSENWFGEEMFWSSYGTKENLRMVEDVGFEVRKWEVKGTGENFRPGDVDYGIEFLWVTAEKKA